MSGHAQFPPVMLHMSKLVTAAHSDSREADMLETVPQHTPHPLVHVVQVLQWDQPPRKVITSSVVITLYLLRGILKPQGHCPCCIKL